MKFNFKNRVHNFKFTTSDVFVPLHEAIMNSIQAIEERENFDDSQINITIERDSYRIGGFTSGIFSIEIKDNGIGFVERNYESFCTSDSDYKFELGGKGVGRINWLKAFEIIHIKSVYEENNQRYQRIFSFSIDEEIHNEKVTIVSKETPIETTILLYNLKQEYRSATEVSLKEISNKVLEHFATYFVIGAMPKMVIKDENEEINLNEFFEAEKFIKTQNEVVVSNDTTFNLRHVFLNASTNNKHKIYICAQNRVVCSYDINNIEGLPTTFNIDDKKAIYQCYVHGEFLDNDVNSERTYFSNVIFEQEEDNSAIHFELAINLYQVVYTQINKFLDNYLNPMKDVRDNQIYDYIENYCPQYKYLIKYAKEELKNISYAVASNPEKLISELNKLNNKINIKQHQQIGKTLSSDSEDINEKIFNLATPLVENLRSEFVNFVQKKIKAIELLEKLIVSNPSLIDLIKRFFLIEENNSSDNSNCWIIDEKLAYHYDLVECDHKKATYVYQNNIESITIKFIDFNKILTKDIILNINNLSNNYYIIANELTEDVKEVAKNNKINLLSYSELIDNYKTKLNFLKTAANK